MVSSRQGMSPDMIGRSSQLRRLLDLADAVEVASLDRPEVALLAGEPGIGKSRLLREFVDRLPAAFAVFAMGVQPGAHGRAALATWSRRVGGPSAGWDEVPAPDGVDSSDVDPAVTLLDEAVVRGPVVLVVEDIERIDTASALVVDQLAQQPWPGMLIVGTYRVGDLEPGTPGAELIQRLERGHDVEQFRLERLDRTEVGALVAAIGGAAPSSDLVEALFKRSGGVPFVIEELLRCCGPRSMADDVLTASLPWSLDEAIRQQVVGYPASERSLLEALSVLGGPATFDTLVEVAGVDESAALDALRVLVDRGVVAERGDDVFWFVHALVADAVESQLLGRQRRLLHERCSAVLARDPAADPAALARHAAGAGRFDELAALARSGAVLYLERGDSFRALRLAAEGLTEVPDDPVLLRVATDAAWRLGFLTEAMTTGQRWSAVAVDRSDRIQALRLAGRLGLELGDDATFSSALEALTATAGEVAGSLADDRTHGEAAAAVAQLLMLARRSGEAVLWADRAIEAAGRVGDGLTVARATVERASAQVFVNPSQDEVADGLRAAVATARTQPDLVLLARGINNLLDQVPPHGAEAAALRAELAEAGRAGGFEMVSLGSLRWWEAEAARCSGDLSAFRRAIAEARQWWRLTDLGPLIAAAEAVLAYEEGRTADAQRSFTEFVEALPGDLDVLQRPFALTLAVAAGDRAGASRLVEELLAVPPPAVGVRVLDDVASVVDAALALGISPDRVEHNVLGSWLDDHPSAGDIRRTAIGLLHAARGDHLAAVEAFAVALATPDPRTSVPWLGSLRTGLAASLLATGDRDAARREVRHVLDHELSRWPGIRRDRAEQLAHRLEGAGERSDGELTRREVEVATLLVEGLTNGQLAERLFISPKTAAVHVSNILTKLGLSSRAEIAAWAVRNGLDPLPA